MTKKQIAFKKILKKFNEIRKLVPIAYPVLYKMKFENKHQVMPIELKLKDEYEKQVGSIKLEITQKELKKPKRKRK